MTMIRHHSDERGAAAILFAVFLVVLVGMTAMVVDLGYAYYSKQRLQDALDLATIAAARELDGASGYQEAARQAAARVMDPEYKPEGGFTVGIGCVAPSSPRTANLCIGGYTTRDNQGERLPLGQRFLANDAAQDAARMFGQAESPSFFARIFEVDVIDVGAISTAVRNGDTRAQLSIRSTLVSIDSTRSALLNAVVGGLLGGHLNLSAAAWDGLLKTDINLLDYLDTVLDVETALTVGSYEELLALQNLSAGRLLQVAADVLQRDDSSNISADALAGLLQIAAIIPPSWQVSLGDLVSVAGGTAAAGLDVGLEVLQLVTGMVQVANGRNAIAAEIDLSTAALTGLPVLNILGGVAGVKIKLAVIETPRLSAIGNPEVAKNLLPGDRRRVEMGGIYVRTAQLRLLVQVDLPILNGLTGLITALDNLVGPITPVLNGALQLNLFATLNALLGFLGDLLCIGNCYSAPADLMDIKLFGRSGGDARPPGLDIVLELGGGEAYVTDYKCPAVGGEKTLTVQTASHLAKVQVGQLTNPASVFSDSAIPAVIPVPIVDIGAQSYRKYALGCITGLICLGGRGSEAVGARKPFVGGGLGLLVDSTVIGTGQNFPADVVQNPPNLGMPQTAASVINHSVANVVGSLSGALAGVKLLSYKPAGGATLLSLVITTVTSLLSAVTTALQPVLNFLGALLDPILNSLINALGLQIAGISVETNLTCGSGARIVY